MAGWPRPATVSVAWSATGSSPAMETWVSEATKARPRPRSSVRRRSSRCGGSTSTGIVSDRESAEALLIDNRSVSLWGWGFSYSPSADTSHTTSVLAAGASTGMMGGGISTNEARLAALRFTDWATFTQ